MINSLKITLSSSVSFSNTEPLGVMFQGVIMEKIRSEYARFLHESQLHTYSQNVLVDKVSTNIIWTINTLNDEAKKEISDVIRSCQTIKLQYRDAELTVIKIEETSISYEYLTKQYFFGECDRIIKVRFNTPTSFKHDGVYALFPDVGMLFQSLMRKYDASADNATEMMSDEVLKSLIDNSMIVGYKLKSTRYNVSNIAIPSFMGDITIKINGPQQMINLVWMLMKFGEYSGVGIKTAMGMGSINVLESRNGKKQND